MAEGKALLLPDHPHRWQRRQRCCVALLSRWCRLALAPELIDQLGAGIRNHQFQSGIAFGQITQESHPIGVDVSHHHQQRGIALGQCFSQSGQERVAIGRSGGVDQHGRSSIACGKQHTVGGAAAFEGVLQLKPVPLGAQPPQGDHPRVDRQLDRATRSSGGGHAHQ